MLYRAERSCGTCVGRRCCFLPAPIRGSSLRPLLSFDERKPPFPFADSRLTPHYPSKVPLDDVLRLVAPGADEFVTEKYAFEIRRLLDEWSRALGQARRLQMSSLDFSTRRSKPTRWFPPKQKTLRSKYGLDISRRQFGGTMVPDRERFLRDIKTYFAKWPRLETAEFEIVRASRKLPGHC